MSTAPTRCPGLLPAGTGLRGRRQPGGLCLSTRLLRRGSQPGIDVRAPSGDVTVHSYGCGRPTRLPPPSTDLLVAEARYRRERRLWPWRGGATPHSRARQRCRPGPSNLRLSFVVRPTEVVAESVGGGHGLAPTPGSLGPSPRRPRMASPATSRISRAELKSMSRGRSTPPTRLQGSRQACHYLRELAPPSTRCASSSAHRCPSPRLRKCSMRRRPYASGAYLLPETRKSIRVSSPASSRILAASGRDGAEGAPASISSSSDRPREDPTCVAHPGWPDFVFSPARRPRCSGQPQKLELRRRRSTTEKRFPPDSLRAEWNKS